MLGFADLILPPKIHRFLKSYPKVKTPVAAHTYQNYRPRGASTLVIGHPLHECRGSEAPELNRAREQAVLG